MPPQGKFSNLIGNASIKNWKPHGGLLKGNVPLGGGVGPIRRNDGLIKGGHLGGGNGPHGSGNGPYGIGHMGGNITPIRGPWMGSRKPSWNTWYSHFLIIICKIGKINSPKIGKLYI
jgi:hypothetical protein